MVSVKALFILVPRILWETHLFCFHGLRHDSPELMTFQILLPLLLLLLLLLLIASAAASLSPHLPPSVV